MGREAPYVRLWQQRGMKNEQRPKRKKKGKVSWLLLLGQRDVKSISCSGKPEGEAAIFRTKMTYIFFSTWVEGEQIWPVLRVGYA